MFGSFWFATGTSVEGHVSALHGGLCLDMANFSSIVIPDVDGIGDGRGDNNDQGSDFPDPIAVVGAGVTRKQLNKALRHTGFQFVVDPGADATLGAW